MFRFTLSRCSFDKVEALRAEIRRKELLERKLGGGDGKDADGEGAEEEEEEEAEGVDGELGQDEAKIDETEDQGGLLWGCDCLAAGRGTSAI